MNIMKFMREVRAEGNKVTWSSWPATRSMTIFVFVFCILTAAFLLLADWVARSVIQGVLGV